MLSKRHSRLLRDLMTAALARKVTPPSPRFHCTAQLGGFDPPELFDEKAEIKGHG
jgi:hypothetical protein